MHYSQKLNNEIDARTAELRVLYDGITQLEVYLLSPKFWVDSKVEARDVLHRLDEIRQNANERRWEIELENAESKGK